MNRLKKDTNEEKCYLIKNFFRCPELDYYVQCKNGFTLNKPKTKCKGKKDIKVKILSQKLMPKNSTIKTANLSTIKSKPNPFLNKTNIPNMVLL